MIIGAANIPRVVEKSCCRITEDYYITAIADYRIHSTALMPNIPFEWSKIIPNSIDKSIFINDGNTKLSFDSQIKIQNYLTTHYIGSAPLEYYGPKTKMGREFQLICFKGDPSYKFRSFGTEGAIRGDNASSYNTTSFG
jgi:hypothetical protein